VNKWPHSFKIDQEPLPLRPQMECIGRRRALPEFLKRGCAISSTYHVIVSQKRKKYTKSNKKKEMFNY
jgi:hypothetical protein